VYPPARFLLIPLLGLVVLGAASGPQRTQVVSPGPQVRTFSFAVGIEVPAGAVFDPAAGVTLNGVPVPVTGGPSRFTATVSPGYPLRDHNRLEVVSETAGRSHTTLHRFQYRPDKARLRRIERPNDLIQGPLAHGRLGDWLLENGAARFVVQDVGQRDLYSVGGFGGNVIDLELKSDPGTDNFIEIQPMLNLETVLNAQTVEVVNDGQDGTAAILRVCGPDDLLDFVNPSSTIEDAGITPPPDLDDNDQPVDACTEYRLAPLVDPACESCGAPTWLEVETTVTNFGSEELRMLVGDWYNPGGELEAWARPELLGEALSNEFSTFSHFGFGSAEGVDYALAALPLDPRPPGATPANQFTTSGVTVVLHNASVIASLLGNPPPFLVEPGGERSFTRLLGVGDGDGANAVDMRLRARGSPNARIEGCVTLAGTPVASARVAVVGLDENFEIARQESSLVTKEGPCPNYGGTVSVPRDGSDWHVAASLRGAPYEGGGDFPVLHAFTPVADQVATVDVDLPATGRIEARVLDERGSPLPARVSVIGLDPSPPITVDGAFVPGFGSSTLGLFEDPKEALPFGVVAFGYTDHRGRVDYRIEPGSYQLLVSRGTEYSAYAAPLEVTAGQALSVDVQLARVVDTTGFVSSDFHVHGIRSHDSRIADVSRASQFAGEGVENVIMTDHHVHTDLNPTIRRLGLSRWLMSTIGEEITTFDYGHFNGYPFTIDPTLPSGGSTDWGQAAPPGEDFPSAGAFNATPAEIYALATAGARSTPDTTVQVNHISSHFGPLQIDTSVAGPIQDGLDDAERAGRRLPSVAAAGNLFHPFPALELWNGADRNQQRNFLEERIGIWMNHLNKGLRTVVISDTDTHTFGDLESAGARSWTASPTDVIPAATGGQVANSVDAGRVVGGQGLYVQTRLHAGSTGEIADLRWDGSVDAATTDGAATLEIRVQAPPWARFDRVEVYANAETVPLDASAPYLFGAVPTLTLLEGDCDPTTTGDGDFDIPIVNVHPAVAGGERQDVTLHVPFFGLSDDTWFAVVVKGTDAVCPPMFPVFPRSLDASQNASLADLLDGNVGERGTMALGVTNALYLDVDGVPGFQPPNP
jgi:hypothetical protein